MTCPVRFEVLTVDKHSGARVGRLALGRGLVQTPVFMPVGTQAAIRTVAPLFLDDLGVQILLANTYHLHQRPGEATVEKLGGLHRFMGVTQPILTDSGGFQVFSLDKKEVSEEGVGFATEVDGKPTFLSPERSMEVQQKLGADIAMAFDECLPADAPRAQVEASVERTARWAARSLAAHQRADQSLFGIVQGGMVPALRERSVRQVTSLGFDGFAVGGLSVGEGPETMNRVLEHTTALMPPAFPRYLMGVGRPQDLVDGVALGVDMFDCVIPTRHARGGIAYTFQGRLRITHSRYRRDAYPLDTACRCYTCAHFSRGYLNHLYQIGEVLGTTLVTVHNLAFFQDLMRRIRDAIPAGSFNRLRAEVKALYPEERAEPADAAEAGDAPEALPRARRAPQPARAPEAPAPAPERRPRARNRSQGARRGRR